MSALLLVAAHPDTPRQWFDILLWLAAYIVVFVVVPALAAVVLFVGWIGYRIWRWLFGPRRPSARR